MVVVVVAAVVDWVRICWEFEREDNFMRGEIASGRLLCLRKLEERYVAVIDAGFRFSGVAVGGGGLQEAIGSLDSLTR